MNKRPAITTQETGRQGGMARRAIQGSGMTSIGAAATALLEKIRQERKN